MRATLANQVLAEVERAASQAGRHNVIVPSRDLARLDAITGKRERSLQALARLERAGRVHRVRKDLVVLGNAGGADVDVFDLIAAASPTHLVTGGRALQYHGLTDQHFFTVLVLVPSTVRGFIFRGSRVAFLETSPQRLWGWSGTDGPRIASPARAVVDALSHPRYGVSLYVAVEALRMAAQRDPGFLQQLVATVDRLGSHAVARRTGLVVEQTLGRTAAAPLHRLIGPSRTPVPLRPGGGKHGPVDSNWRVIINISPVPSAS
jgi:predicted transcriptional regulator of viral defense system